MHRELRWLLALLFRSVDFATLICGVGVFVSCLFLHLPSSFQRQILKIKKCQRKTLGAPWWISVPLTNCYPNHNLHTMVLACYMLSPFLR